MLNVWILPVLLLCLKRLLQRGLHEFLAPCRHCSLTAQRPPSADCRQQRCRAANEISSGSSDAEWADDPASYAAPTDTEDGFGAAAEFEEADADAQQGAEFDPDDFTAEELEEMEAEAAAQRFEVRTSRQSLVLHPAVGRLLWRPLLPAVAARNSYRRAGLPCPTQWSAIFQKARGIHAAPKPHRA